MQKVKEPESGTAPTATPATPSTKVIEGPVAPKVQGDVKKMMSVRSAINDARDDLVAAFMAAGIPLKKIEHRSIQGFLQKHYRDGGCYPKDDKLLQVFLVSLGCCA